MRDRLQVGVHRRGRLVTIGRLLGERAKDDEVEVLGHVLPMCGGRVGCLGEMLHGDLHRAVPGEGNVGGQQFVQDDPRRIKVGGLVDGRPARLLRRQVLGGADDRPLLRHLARTCAGDAEVRHLHDAFRVDDDVVRLDVAVDDAVAVRVPERGEDLTCIRNRDRDRARPPRPDELFERASLHVLHDDEVRAVRLTSVVDRDDVRMREPGGMRRLAAEALDELLVVRVAVVQDLDRDAPAQLLVLREVDVGHAAAAELACDPVAAGEEGSGEGVLDGHRASRG